MSYFRGWLPTDKEKALYPAIKNVFGEETKHRDCKYKNNCLEQDHRGIKSRYKPIFCALIFCTAFEEIRQLFRMAHKTRAEKRGTIASKFQQFNNLAIQNI